jgi:N-acetylated-alpha-linked acidic dipeptidase
MRASALSSILIPGFVCAAAGSLCPGADPSWEEKFRATPVPQNIREYMQRMSARPHHVGSLYDKDNAEWMLEKFKSWGLDAKIENFRVLFPTPKERLVEMLEPEKFTARLDEPTIARDLTSGQKSEQLPVYNVYSIDGDVTAPLVYVNYGVPADYEQLDRMGISVKGAIVIARYGGSWRGIKPKVAAEHGAVGCIIYSDPFDDGYHVADAYPAGPERPAGGAQRGSVMDMPLYPGDPLTPGVGATEDAKRLAVSEAKTLTKIPVLPLSYGDARPMLAALKGPVVPEGWAGALPITYHVGPGPAKVHLKLKFNWDLKTLYDVIVRIPGSQYPDEWVIRGNHHDAWVNGAMDPGSGASAQIEEMRGISELLKQGWKPKRTIVYCLWDGEEPGLLGSTEWAEAHANDLDKHAVVYINSDSNGRGFLNASGSHTLENFVNGLMKEITDPETEMSVWKRYQLSRIEKEPDKRKDLRTRPDLRISALGSGSDYTVFLQHLGVASLNLEFGGEDNGGGVYHSIYDDFYWYTHFADVEFVYGKALAQVVGTAVIRLADAEVLPFQFGDFADTVHTYVEELKKLAGDEKTQIEERNREIDEGVFSASADPRRKLLPPPKQTVPGELNFAALESSAQRLSESARKYDAARQKAGGDLIPATGASQTPAVNPLKVQAVNARLIESERRLTDPAGLPGRPWFRHMLYAPGFYTGYAVKTIPGVREAIEQKNWPEAESQIRRMEGILTREAELIDEAAAALAK